MVRNIAKHTGIHDTPCSRPFAAFAPRLRARGAADGGYEDRALLLAGSRPSVSPRCWLYAERSRGEARGSVLEVGAGCGYAAALLAHLAREVHSLEIVPELQRAESDARQAPHSQCAGWCSAMAAGAAAKSAIRQRFWSRQALKRCQRARRASWQRMAPWRSPWGATARTTAHRAQGPFRADVLGNVDLLHLRPARGASVNEQWRVIAATHPHRLHPHLETTVHRVCSPSAWASREVTCSGNLPERPIRVRRMEPNAPLAGRSTCERCAIETCIAMDRADAMRLTRLVETGLFAFCLRLVDAGSLAGAVGNRHRRQ